MAAGMLRTLHHAERQGTPPAPRRAANRKVLLEAEAARRAESEAAALRRDLAAATEALDKARADGNDARERLRGAEAEAMRRLAGADLEAERLAVQLKVCALAGGGMGWAWARPLGRGERLQRAAPHPCAAPARAGRARARVGV